MVTVKWESVTTSWNLRHKLGHNGWLEPRWVLVFWSWQCEYMTDIRALCYGVKHMHFCLETRGIGGDPGQSVTRTCDTDEAWRFSQAYYYLPSNKLIQLIGDISTAKTCSRTPSGWLKSWIAPDSTHVVLFSIFIYQWKKNQTPRWFNYNNYIKYKCLKNPQKTQRLLRLDFKKQ